jgi:hypothetical protein
MSFLCLFFFVMRNRLSTEIFIKQRKSRVTKSHHFAFSESHTLTYSLPSTIIHRVKKSNSGKEKKQTSVDVEAPEPKVEEVPPPAPEPVIKAEVVPEPVKQAPPPPEPVKKTPPPEPVKVKKEPPPEIKAPPVQEEKAALVIEPSDDVPQGSFLVSVDISI